MKKLFNLFAISLCSLLVLAGCTNSNSVKTWDTVSISYTANFSDGKVFEDRAGQTGLSFVVWSEQVIQGLNESVLGMNVGQTKTITITPDQGYGLLYNKNNIQKISQLVFDQLNIQVKKWSTQKLGNLEWVIKWTEKDSNGNSFVLFDINPRQTRDILTYKITVLSKK